MNVSIIGMMLTLWGCLDKMWPPAVDTATAQGVANPADLLLEGFSHGAAGAGARKRGAPQSPVFCGAKNAPK
jgi:hypothetical protein